MLSRPRRSSLHRFSLLCATAALLYAPPPALTAQTHPSATAQAHNRFGPDPAPTPAELENTPLVAPLFLETDAIDSAVTVVNGVMQASGGTLTLRDLDGDIAATKHITFAPHSSTVIPLKALLAEAGVAIHGGSVLLQQDASIKGPVLLAQLSLTLHTGSQSAFLEEEFGMPVPMMGSATLQGIAAQTANAPVVAITSTSEVAQTIQTSCLGDPSASANTFELPVGATVLVQACAGSGPASWRRLHDGDLNTITALTAGSRPAPRSLGLSIHSDGLPGAFYAFGFALNGSPDRAQLQPVDFYDPKESGSPRIVYTGVPVGPNETLQPGTYVPVLTVANFSAQPRIATVSHHDSSSAAPGTPVKPQVVEQLTLAPGTTRTVELADLPGSGLQHSFTIASDGAPGDVQAHLYSYRASSDQRVEMLAKDAADFHNGGNHPWSIAGGNTSTLLLFNPTGQQMEFQVRISGSGSTWLDLVYLAPFETRALSINDLIAKETGDHDHRKLPKSLQSGEVQWSTRMPSDGFGRLLVSNPATGLSRSFSCAFTLDLCSTNLGPAIDASMLMDDVAAFYGIQATFCAALSPQSCYSGAVVGTGFSFNTNWQASSNTQIASSTNTQVNLKGIAPGNFNYTGTVIAGSCQAQVGGGGTICSAPPTDDTITSLGASPIYSTVTIFNSHLSGASASYTGWLINEYSPTLGQDGCYQNPALNPALVPSGAKLIVTGTPGTVDSNNNVPDRVGWLPASVAYIRNNSPLHSNTPLITNFPCGATIYQTMTALCPQAIPDGLQAVIDADADNTQTETISAASVQNCKRGVCNILNQ